MSLQISRENADTFVFIGDINSAELARPWPERKQQWKELSGEVKLDLSAVELMDTAGLAWIIQLVDQGRQAGIEFKLINSPAILANLAKISDVESLLPLQ